MEEYTITHNYNTRHKKRMLEKSEQENERILTLIKREIK